MAVGFILQAIVAALAWVVARRRPYHVPFAIYASVAAAADPLALLVQQRLTGVSAPYVGIARVWFHAHQALHLAPLAAMAAMALTTFPRVRRLEHLWGASAFALTVLFSTYPTIRCTQLGCVLVAIHAGYQAVTWVSVVLWARSREWPTMTQAVALAVAAGDLALWAGRLAGDVFTDWGLGYGAQFAALGFVAVLHIVWMRTIREQPRSPRQDGLGAG